MSAAMGVADWRDYDQAALDAQYDNHAASGEAGVAALSRLRDLAAENRAGLPVRPGIAYGDAPGMLLDIYPAEAGAASGPCLVLVHGGGWLRGDAAGSGFWTRKLAEWGVAHIVVSHGKRPDTTLAEMAGQVTAAWRFIRRHAHLHGIDPVRLHLAGISSGATLAALAALSVQDEAPPASLLLLGGMYDLEPVRRSSRNAALALSPADALTLSPLHRAAELAVLVTVAYGEQETAEFRRQAEAMAARIGSRARLLQIAGANHFSQTEALLDDRTPLSRRLHDLLTQEITP
ncbi:MAG: nlhH3 [Rhodospirillales bacterium]|nr:nlhH3 [Rhodospirillales bacterium]